MDLPSESLKLFETQFFEGRLLCLKRLTHSSRCNVDVDTDSFSKLPYFTDLVFLSVSFLDCKFILH